MHTLLKFIYPSLLFFSCTIREKKPEPVVEIKQDPFINGYNLIREGEQMLKDGDLVVRNGKELTSQYIRKISKQDPAYSHSGIVFFENGYPFIYHILTGDENPDGKLRRDTLEIFCHPQKNYGYAIYRYQMDREEIKIFQRSIYSWYSKKMEFDSTFNLRTNDKMYCSEMIMKALSTATDNRIKIDKTKPTKEEVRVFSRHLKLDSVYARQLEVIAIDNLYLNPYCNLVKKFEFFPSS